MTHRLLPLLLAGAVVFTACGDSAGESFDQPTNPPVASGPETSGPGASDPAPSVPGTTDPATPSSADDLDRLAAARALWAATDLTAYRLETRELCFCLPIVWIDTVVDGQVVTHESGTEEISYDPGGRTMELLFAGIEKVLNGSYASIDLEFDAETGAVERYFVDFDLQMADEEGGVEVVAVEPIDPATLDAP